MSSKPEKPAKDKSPDLRKSLGVPDGIAILIGITIGAGIYSTPHEIAQYQSSFQTIIALWLIAGAFVYVGGLIYAELGTRLPNTGGEYVYISRAFGPHVGFVFGWAQLFIIRTSPAAGLAIVTVRYFEHFVDLTPWGETVLSVAIILAIGAINYVGIQRASAIQILTTVIKVGGLFGLVAAGLIMVAGQDSLLAETVAVDPDTDPQTFFGRFAATMMLIVFSYLGWDRVGYAAGEMKNPKRTIPLTMFWGIAVVVIVYMLANFLYHYVLGLETVRHSERVASVTASVLFGATGASLIAIIVMISAAGSTNGTIMTAPRVYYAMAKDKLFFSWFDYVHPKYHTPSRAIIAHCVWAIVILLVRSNFEDIVSGMVFAVLIFYVFTTLALFKLRRQGVGGPQVFQVPLILPVIYLIGLVLLLGMRGIFEWRQSLVDLALIATGIPFAFYFGWARKRHLPK